MVINRPIFADLSTYKVHETLPFYERVFEWTFYESDGYYSAFTEHTEVVGLYETPEKFKQMRMPHFWMTYIKVSRVDEMVEKAKTLNGIIEAHYEMKGIGKVALIRDPQGAGFTIYEGDVLKDTRTKNTKNTLIWNEIHTSNAKRIIPFYEGLFGWNIGQVQNGYYKVLNQDKEHIGDIMEIDNRYKGKYEYWICTFGVDDLSNSKKLILENGGYLVAEEDNRILCTDNSNEAFFYIKAVP